MQISKIYVYSLLIIIINKIILFKRIFEEKHFLFVFNYLSYMLKCLYKRCYNLINFICVLNHNKKITTLYSRSVEKIIH